MTKAISFCYRHITQCHTLKDLEKVPSPKVRSIYPPVKVINEKMCFTAYVGANYRKGFHFTEGTLLFQFRFLIRKL